LVEDGEEKNSSIEILYSYDLTVASDHDSPSPSVGTTTYLNGTNVTASVTSPDTQGTTRYVSTGWSGTGSVPPSGSGQSTNFLITEDSSITWNWKTQYYLTTAAGTGGTVDASDWHDSGATPSIQAYPTAGYLFNNWSGDVPGGSESDNPVTITMSAAKSITASFELNAAPTISNVNVPSSTIMPLEENTKTVLVNFTVTDTNGYEDVDVSSAYVNFTKAGESTRRGTSCSNIGAGGNEINLSCSVDMWYFDEAGTWNVTVYVEDVSDDAGVDDSETIDYGSLAAIQMVPAVLNWPEIIKGDTNTPSSEHSIINHTGNALITQIVINATELVGESFPSHKIYAENFTAGLEGGLECDATPLANNEETIMSGAVLERGNLSEGGGVAQEEFYYCLKTTPSTLIKQAYSTALSRAWYLKILTSLAVFGLARKKKEKKKKKILGFLKELKDEGQEISLDELSSLTQELKRESEVAIPLSLFRSELAPAESLVKYLKENMKMRLSEVAELLKRDDRSIWTTYNNGIKKKQELVIDKREETKIPISVFNDRRLSILESLTTYLRKEKLSNIEIAEIINRDPRNVFTVYKRALKKLNKKSVVKND